MKCPDCGRDIPDNARVCPFCGKRIIRIKPKSICPNCGAEVPDGASVCPGCGCSVRRRTEEEKREAERQMRAAADSRRPALKPDTGGSHSAGHLPGGRVPGFFAGFGTSQMSLGRTILIAVIAALILAGADVFYLAGGEMQAGPGKLITVFLLVFAVLTVLITALLLLIRKRMGRSS